MLGAIGIGAGAAALVHAGVYRWKRAQARRADLTRLPVGPGGIIAGAEPFELAGSPTHAVLVIHGFGDTPQTVRRLADHLHRAHGWTVRAPLLPGHGRTLADFDAHGSADWRYWSIGNTTHCAPDTRWS